MRGVLESAEAFDIAGSRREGRRPLPAGRAAEASANAARRTAAPGRKPPSGALVADLTRSGVQRRAAAGATDGAGALALAA